MRNSLRWIVWWMLLGLFTLGLLGPPMAGSGPGLLSPEVSFWLSKSVHLVGYALLAALVGWLPTTDRLRVGLWVFLASHAALTEFLQTFIPGRFGSIQDVVIDLAGITLGILLLWRARLR